MCYACTYSLYSTLGMYKEGITYAHNTCTRNAYVAQMHTMCVLVVGLPDTAILPTIPGNRYHTMVYHGHITLTIAYTEYAIMCMYLYPL